MTPKEAYQFLKQTYGPLVEDLNIHQGDDIVINGVPFIITQINRHKAELTLTARKFWEDQTSE